MQGLHGRDPRLNRHISEAELKSLTDFLYFERYKSVGIISQIYTVLSSI